MILLDASVLIAYLRNRDPLLAKELNDLELGICGPTRSEILHGAREENDFKKLLVLLDQFHKVELHEELWDQVGRRLYELRTHGIIVPFTDAVLATLAIEQNIELWAFDSHFELMTTILPLRLYKTKHSMK